MRPEDLSALAAHQGSLQSLKGVAGALGHRGGLYPPDLQADPPATVGYFHLHFISRINLSRSRRRPVARCQYCWCPTSDQSSDQSEQVSCSSAVVCSLSGVNLVDRFTFRLQARERVLCLAIVQQHMQALQARTLTHRHSDSRIASTPLCVLCALWR